MFDNHAILSGILDGSRVGCISYMIIGSPTGIDLKLAFQSFFGDFMQKNADNVQLFKMFDKLKSDLIKEMEVWELAVEEVETLKAKK